jgi:hypothetical protein
VFYAGQLWGSARDSYGCDFTLSSGKFLTSHIYFSSFLSIFLILLVFALILFIVIGSMVVNVNS